MTTKRPYHGTDGIISLHHNEMRFKSSVTTWPDYFQTHKNLGPSVADRQQYIGDVLETHLLNDANYEHLPPEMATKELRTQHKKFCSTYF
jgi:hypothetical protein